MLLALPIGGVLYVITAALKSSDVYRDAVQIAKTDARVVQLLGTPISEDVSINGSIRYSGPAGEAQSASGCTPERQGQRAGGCHAQAWPLDLPDTDLLRHRRRPDRCVACRSLIAAAPPAMT
ncbi:cytochrome c oxidase assembly factor Coa1 family protein [Xanthomonas citri]|uniref:cytochrome c oxidase assembly factor Coa1 family protein n=1 Tax=Xanthomonas citri TaxID=346 RepID=UPI001CC16D1A|nr:cytochrome c oxidase assembly factor Coa1 family protein [Xanthomonas citri]